MKMIEIAFGVLFALLCIMTVRSDLTIGLIRNKTLLIFSVLAAILNVIFYGLFANDLFPVFCINILLIACVSLVLFYTHSFAGGDAKLAIVLALCYPGTFYLRYGSTEATLLIAIGLAILIGYLYLLIYAILHLIRTKYKWNLRHVQKTILNFFKSFCIAMLYIFVINILAMIASKQGILINNWFVRILCLVIAWIVGNYAVFHRWILLVPIISFDILGSVYLARLPFSIHPADYILVIILLLCRMLITTSLYENVKVEKLKKSMILSTAASILMQDSKISGLPSISTEDLKSRLTESEIKSVQCWATKHHVTEVTVVKKIPFSIFLMFGYLFYFFIWCVI